MSHGYYRCLLCSVAPTGLIYLDLTSFTGVDTPAYSVSPFGLYPSSWLDFSHCVLDFPHRGLDPRSPNLNTEIQRHKGIIYKNNSVYSVFFPQEIADQVRNEGVGSVSVIFASLKGAFSCFQRCLLIISKGAFSCFQRCLLIISKVIFAALKDILFLWER